MAIHDRLRKIFTVISLLAVFMLPVSTLYDPAVYSRLLGILSDYALLPGNIDVQIAGTKKYHHAKSGSGLKYVGQWKEGAFHGTGTYFTLNGTYDGEWKKGKKHGMGTLTKPKGGKYTGEYINDMKDGPGTETWHDGSKFEGIWKEGRWHQGAMTYADGAKYSGSWKENEALQVLQVR